MRQDFHSGLGDEEGVFPLRGGEFVFGDDGPTVFFIDENVGDAHVDHRFNGENHARHEEHALSAGVVVVHLRIFVKLQSDAMTAKVTNDTEAVATGKRLNGTTNVADMSPGFHCGSTGFQTLKRDINQLLLARRGFADDKHSGGITEVAVKNRAHINVDNVAFFKELIF